MTVGPRIGLLGGTFDPIHLGHLDAAEAARTALHLDQIRLIPSSHPAHRHQPHASAFHRFALAALAVADRPGYSVSDIELARTGPTYTADTLRTLSGDGWRPSQLFFILGADAFAEISSWREFPAVLDGANFVVIARPGTTLDAAATRTPLLRERIDLAAQNPPAQGKTRVILVEARTRDISSTAIRARLAAGQSIDDLVPAAVARHIVTHQLYGAVGDLHDDKEGR